MGAMLRLFQPFIIRDIYIYIYMYTYIFLALVVSNIYRQVQSRNLSQHVLDEDVVANTSLKTASRDETLEPHRCLMLVAS